LLEIDDFLLNICWWFLTYPISRVGWTW